MDEDRAPQTLYDVSWLRLFPWLRLFKAPGAAADLKKLLLASVGILLLSAGWDVLDRAFPASRGITPEVFEARKPLGPDSLAMVPWWLTEPPRFITAPFFGVFDPPGIEPRADPAPPVLLTNRGQGSRFVENIPPEAGSRLTFLHAVLAALWTVAVWGLIGGAIARIAVVGLTKGERIGPLEALNFAGKKALPLVGTPMIPLVGIVLVTTLMAGFGLLYRIPGSLGALAAGAFAVIPLLGGMLLASILIGLAVSWPLMQASVAAEAEDGFDAMSRSYAYVRQKPWHLLFYVALAFVAGTVGLAFVDVFARLVVHLTTWALGFGAPARRVGEFFHGGGAEASSAVKAAHSFWIGVVALLVRSWIYSFFWTAATVVYLLLRGNVDGTPFTTVAFRTNPGLTAPRPDQTTAQVPGTDPPAAPLREPDAVRGV